jgi:hypothetical protein
VYLFQSSSAANPATIQAYNECLSNVMLSGPTLFGPIIKATHEIVNNQIFKYVRWVEMF